MPRPAPGATPPRLKKDWFRAAAIIPAAFRAAAGGPLVVRIASDGPLSALLAWNE
jgi:hypothetical protein